MTDNGNSGTPFTIDDVLHVRLDVEKSVPLTDAQSNKFITSIREHFDAEALRFDDDSIYIRSLRLYIDIENNETTFRLTYPESKDRLIDLAYIANVYMAIAGVEDGLKAAKHIDFVYLPRASNFVPDYLRERVVKDIDLNDLSMKTLAGEATLYLVSSENDGESWIVWVTARYGDPEARRLRFRMLHRDNAREQDFAQEVLLEELIAFWDLAHVLVERIDANA